MSGLCGCKVFSWLTKDIKLADNLLLPDIPDQPAIVRQYMRHTSQIGSAKTLETSVKRALQM